jgi:hypothetical protein
MSEVTFDDYVRQMYVDNVDERFGFGEPILQPKEYREKFGSWLLETYEAKYGAEEAEDE